MFAIAILAICVFSASAVQRDCTPSVTTASGTRAPTGEICPGDLIFEDNFDFIDFSKWSRENTLSGGGNFEFQFYTTNDLNSYAKDGDLEIVPTLMADRFGEGILTGGEFNVEQFGPCTDDRNNGCARVGNEYEIINPIISAKFISRSAFSFKYGRTEIRAKIPAGDWLWPALWMLPKNDIYGWWPASGEIDLMEARGNRNFYAWNKLIGIQEVASTLWSSEGYRVTEWARDEGWAANYHVYTMEWAPDHITFGVDGNYRTFYDTGHPFNHEFYLIINLAVGGINYFPDEGDNPGGKPWRNDSPNPMRDFWYGRWQWEPTWNYPDKAFRIDYVRVWAL